MSACGEHGILNGMSPLTLGIVEVVVDQYICFLFLRYIACLFLLGVTAAVHTDGQSVQHGQRHRDTVGRELVGLDQLDPEFGQDHGDHGESLDRGELLSNAKIPKRQQKKIKKVNTSSFFTRGR